MTSDAKMVVRYDEAKRAAVEQTLRKLVRTQGTLLLILGMLFGALIDTGERSQILWGYLLGGGLMIVAAIVELFLGVAAERKSLEEVAPPLSQVFDDAP